VGTFVRITSYPFVLPASTAADGWQLQYTSTFGAPDGFSFTIRDEDGLYYSDPFGESKSIVYITPGS
jgi:hypothetical protein